MKSTSFQPKSNFVHLGIGKRIISMLSPGLSLRVGATLILAGLLVSSFHWNSAASTSKKTALSQNLVVAAPTTQERNSAGESFGLTLIFWRFRMHLLDRARARLRFRQIPVWETGE